MTVSPPPPPQEMSSAVITYCGHFFHGNCLRKWLYVQETCPMCHQTVRPTPTGPSPAPGNATAAQPQRDVEEPDPGTEEVNQDLDDNTETQSDAETPDPAVEEESCGDQGCEAGDGVRAGEPEGEAVQGLRFTSSGDFVGFVRPATSCSSAEVSDSDSLRSKTPPNMKEEDSTAEGYSESKTTVYPKSPQHGEGEHDIETPESCLKSNNAESNPEASDTSHKSCKENSDSSSSSQTHKSSCTERLNLSPHRPPVCPPPPPLAAQTQTTETDCPASVP